MADRLRRQRIDALSAGALGLAALAAVAVGLMVPRVDPLLLVAGLGLSAVASLVIWRFGRLAPSLVWLALVPLIPVTGIGIGAEALGGRGPSLRAGLLLLGLLVLLIVYRRGIPKPAPGLRPVVAGLVALAGVGAFVAAANPTEQQSVIGLLEYQTGQPLLWAGVLIFLSAQVQRSPAAKEWMLIAFSIAVWAQAAFVAYELGASGAFDPVRGAVRAEGTVGANFVSAYGMMAFFIGMAELRFGSRRRRMRTVGALTMVAALAMIVAVVARGGLIGLVLGFAYLVFTDARVRRRTRIAAALAAALLAGWLFTPVGDLWSERLSERSRFDRPATWVSGVRIGVDNPLTGLGGEAEVLDAVERVPAYGSTPYGPSTVIPHNTWILSFADGGALSLAVLLAITAAAVGAVHRRPDRSPEGRYYVAALVGIAAISMINNVFRHPELVLVVLFLLALATRRAPPPPDAEPSARPLSSPTTEPSARPL